ncbi:DNA-binding transcriptional LysR family regulator [Sphingomonas endophytica]|uniref:DNA-binding transcriptional LysR family regulator n=1 Tax=Sphingomonas endophytica TaxID=869719 RepID=A0A7X0MMH7_9SPHN|nr:LysR family transcriptional regulator [Sphingomonas endophytica]MBB6504289.1 DNA-binding transcriptional LysR family regulator [Sphingomonas endophytica]
MIDRYHLRYFLAVVDTGNFSRAAAACNVAQPTLSVGIARLEASLGRTLFNRTNRRVALTEAGAGLLAHARAIESGFAAAERAVTGAAAAPLLRLGVLTTIPRHAIERWLAARSGDRVELVEGNERDLRARLARGRIDAALTILRDGDDRGAGQHLLTEGYALAIGSTHPLAGRASLSAEEIAHEPMIVRRHCEMLSETSRFFTARGVRPFFPARTTSDDRALSHVRARLGITVMPESFHADGVARVPLADFDASRDVGLVFAAHAPPDAALVTGLREALTYSRSSRT